MSWFSIIKKEKEDEDEKPIIEKESGAVSFGGHGANPELFNIKYGGGKRGKKRREEKVRD
tara:strand:- start:7177 stop:7356 length:180 start_codon:yes stop_codon:yes gene_type:complete